MKGDFTIENFKKIVVEKPVDIIIDQLRELIISGQLQPGDKLPSERKLSEKLNIGRTHVREAIRKLEFYGILKTHPQSGTVVAGIGLSALECLISDVLHMESSDFKSLVETRVLLEVQSARLAAIRRSEEDLQELKTALNQYENQVLTNKPAVDEDLMYHLKVVECSKNNVLKSLMLIIIPDILANYSKYNICTDDHHMERLNEHKKLYNSILNNDSKSAAKLMREHLNDILEQGKDFF